MKEKLSKNKTARRSRRLRISALGAALLTVAALAAFVPLINSSAAENHNLELEIHRLDNDITKLNKEMPSSGRK